MKYLGRIICKDNGNEKFPFIEIINTFNNENSITIPTLIIGKKNAEKLFGKENIHVLDKKIRENLYWTFDLYERRNDYERDLNTFRKKVIQTLIKSVKYYYFNLFTCSYTQVKKMISKLKDKEQKIAYINNEHIYLMADQNIYGISLKEIEYIGINREKFLKWLTANSKIKILYSDKFIDWKVKKQLNGNKYIVPYVYFLLKEK